MVKEKLVSCNAEILYENGGYYDPGYPLEELLDSSKIASEAVTFESLLFEGSCAVRTRPIFNANPAERTRIDNYFQHVTDAYKVCAPSILVKIKNALIWNNMVFSVVGNEAYAIYETYRFPDRDQQGIDLRARLPPTSEHQSLPDDAGNLFIGSAGSFNYGHWLTDDFAKMAAISHIKKSNKKVRILMSGFNPIIDPVRLQGAALFTDTTSGDETKYLLREVCYSIDDLYFPTPISFHPVLKNKESLEFTKSFLLTAAESRSRRLLKKDLLFVNRSKKWSRHITNVESLRPLLDKIGMYESYFDDVHLLDQVSLFHNAGSVIGIMGAAMANQIFCRPGSDCIHMAPAGWDEPFYWDICDQTDQIYKIYFGEADTGSSPAAYQRSFAVDAEEVVGMLSGKGTGKNAGTGTPF
jgi:hypothetical protein